jgi:nucleotide-binding universal stress UspA family protein
VKTIVVATDGSGSSRAALELALQLAGEVAAAVWSVSVQDSLIRHSLRPVLVVQADAA